VQRIWANLRDEVQRARELEDKIGVKK